MKMKKTLFKLFLMICISTAFWRNDVMAAETVDLDRGNIFIGGKGPKDNDIIGYGNSLDEATQNPLPVNANHEAGYTFEGDIHYSNDITIDIGQKTLNLTFKNFRTPDSITSRLNIISGTVRITLSGSENILQAKTGQSAINLSPGAKLYFIGGGKIGIYGADNQNVISGGGGFYIDTGTVTLNKKGSATTCEEKKGLFIEVGEKGVLYCNDSTNGQEAELGDILITQKPKSSVSAAGLYKVNYQKESLSSTKIKAGDKITIKYTAGGSTTSLEADVVAGANSDEGNLLPIDEILFGKTITISNQTLTLDSRPSNSSSATVKQNESYALEADGIIEKIDVENTQYVYLSEDTNQPATQIELAEYMKKNNKKWETFPLETVSKLSPGYYYVRAKSTNTAFATKYKVLHIEPGKILTFEPEPFKFDAIYKNITNTSQELTINNYSDKNVEIKSITLSGQDSSCFTLTGATPFTIQGRIKGGSSSDKTIHLTPKVDLDSGTYKTTILIGYSLDNEPKNPLEIPVTFEVEKAGQSKPTDALQATNITHNSATLNDIVPNAANTDPGNGVEYSFSTDGEWDEKNVSDKPQFTGKLSPETKYYFLARYKETKNYKASDPIVVEGETEKASSINFEEQKLEFPYSNREYTVTVGKDGKPQTYKDVASIDIPDDWCKEKTTITITDLTKNGTQTLTLPAIRKAPTPKAVDEKIIGDKGSITGVSTAMQFRKKSGKTTWTEWEDCPGRTIDSAEPGDYQVRLKATSTEFPSAIAPVTVHKGPSIEVNLQGADFEEIPYGTPTSGKIIIQNRDTVPVRLEGITLSAENFVITEGAKNLDPSASVEWGIQPKEKLNVGTYESDIIVSYDDSQDDASDDENPDDTTGDGTDDTNTDNTTNDNTDNKEQGDSQVEGQAAGDAQEVTGDEQSNIRTASIAVKATIVKAPQTDVPPVPTEKSKTATSITLETIPNNPVTGAKAQYSKDGGRTWQDSPTFTGLSPNREYTFVARYAETDNYNASDISSGEVTITTAEKNDDSSDGVDSKANGNNNSNGSNGSNGTNGTNSTNGTGTGTGTNNGTGTGTGAGTGTNSGTNGSGDSSSNGVLSSAKTGDLNNIQLWVTLMIGSYLSCAVVIRNRLKKSNS